MKTFWQYDQKNFDIFGIIKFTQAASCQSSNVLNVTATSLKASSSNYCQIAQISNFFTKNNSQCKIQNCQFSSSACTSYNLKISNDQNALIVAPPFASASCNFRISCSLTDSVSNSNVATVLSNLFSVSTGTASTCFQLPVTAIQNVYLLQQNTGTYSLQLSLSSIIQVASTSYSLTSCSIQRSGSNAIFFQSSSISSNILTSLIQLGSSQAMLAYKYNCLINDSSASISFYMDSSSFNIVICLYTAVSNKIFYQKNSNSGQAIDQYTFSQLFSSSDASNCPSLSNNPSISMTPTSTQISITTNTLSIPPNFQVTTDTTIGFKSSYNMIFTFSIFSGTNNYISNSFSIQVLDCSLVSSYTIGTAQSLTYYSKDEFSSVTLDIQSFIGITPPDNSCSYSSCQIQDSSNVVSPYFALSSACSNSSTTYTQQCQFSMTTPNQYTSSTYYIACTITGSTNKVKSSAISFTFYYCDGIDDLIQYTYLSSSSTDKIIDIDYYPPGNSFMYNTNIAQAIVTAKYSVCITSCSATATNNALQTLLNSNLIFDTYIISNQFKLQQVNVQSVRSYYFSVQCNINVGKSTKSIKLNTGNYQINVKVNCLNQATYTIDSVGSFALVYFSQDEFNNMDKSINIQTDTKITPPDSTCTYSSCDIYDSSVKSIYFNYSSCSSSFQCLFKTQNAPSPSSYMNQSNYKMVCTLSGTSPSLTVQSKTFSFIFYYCDSLNNYVYSTQAITKLNYDYYPIPSAITTTTINLNVVYAKYSICISNCQTQNQNISNILTYIAFTETNISSTYNYSLQNVNVQQIQYFQFQIMCNIYVGTSLTPKNLESQYYQISVTPNCKNIATYYINQTTSQYNINFNQNYSSFTIQNLNVLTFFTPPLVSCIQSCYLYNQSTLKSSLYAIVQNLDSSTGNFEIKIDTSKINIGSNNLKLVCSNPPNITIQSYTYNIFATVDCNDWTSFNSINPSGVQVQQFQSNYSNGIYSYLQLQYFSNYISYPYNRCSFYSCQITGSPLAQYSQIDNYSNFYIVIDTTNPILQISGLQLKCQTQNGSAILSGQFSLQITCGLNWYSQPQSLQISNSVAENNVLVTQKLFWNTSQFVGTTDSILCPLKFNLKNKDKSSLQKAFIIFDDNEGTIQLINNYQFISYVTIQIIVNNTYTYYFPKQSPNLLLINQTCYENSTIVTPSMNFQRVQFAVIKKDQVPIFQFDFFQSSNQLCYIQISDYYISDYQSNNVSLSLSPSAKSFQVSVKQKYIYINGSQTFNIYTKAQGGAKTKIFANLTLVPDCTLEKIYLNPTMPGDNEDFYQMYQTVLKLPVLMINQSSNQVLQGYINKRFKSLNDYYCSFKRFQITKVIQVVNTKQIEISINTYQKYFTLDAQGKFTLKTPLSASFDHYKVYIQAQNINLVQGGDQTNLIDVSVYPYQQSQVPEFLWMPLDISINLLEKKENLTVILPPLSASADKIFTDKGISFITNKYDKYLGNYLFFDLRNVDLYSQNIKLNITLQNSKSNLLTKYSINVNITGLDQRKTYKDLKFNCTAKINDISNEGQLIINFNDSMNTDINASWINQSNTKIKVLPAQQRDLDEDFNPQSIELKWKANQITNNSLIIDINFMRPYEISPLNQQDSLFVQFNQSQALLTSKTNGLMLSKSSIILTHPLKKQIAGSNSVINAYQIGQQILMAMLILGILLKFLGEKSEQYFLLMIRPLQLILHLPIMLIVLPGNILSVFKILIKFAMFDILDQFWNWQNQSVLQFDYSLEPTVLLQLNNIGYGNHNSFLSLSTLGFIVIIYFLRILLTGALGAISCILKGKFRSKNLYEFSKKGLFFNFILQIFIEGFIEFVINGYINVQKLQWNISGEIIGSLYTIFGFVMTLLILPSLAFWINCFKMKKEMQKKKFLNTWGVLYRDYKYSNKYVRLYFLYFICRRILFLCIGFFITNPKYLGVQIILNNMMNLFAIIFIGSIRAQNSKLKNRIEMVNEMFVIVSGLYLCGMTNMAKSQDIIYQNGQQLIYILMIFIGGNMIVVFVFILDSIKLIIIKIYQFIDHKFCKLKQDDSNNKKIIQISEVYKQVISKLKTEQIIEKKPKFGIKLNSKSLVQKMAQKSKVLNMEQIKEEEFEHSNQEIELKKQSINISKMEDINQNNDEEKSPSENDLDSQILQFIQIYKQYQYFFEVNEQSKTEKDSIYKDLHRDVAPFAFHSQDTLQQIQFKQKKVVSIAKSNIKFVQNVKEKKLKLKQLTKDLKMLAEDTIKKINERRNRF